MMLFVGASTTVLRFLISFISFSKTRTPSFPRDYEASERVQVLPLATRAPLLALDLIDVVS